MITRLDDVIGAYRFTVHRDTPKTEISVYLLTLCDYRYQNLEKVIDSVLTIFLDLKRNPSQAFGFSQISCEQEVHLPITDTQNGYVAEVIITRKYGKTHPPKFSGYKRIRMQISKKYARSAELLDSLAKELGIPKKDKDEKKKDSRKLFK